MAGMSQVTALGNLGRDARLSETKAGDAVCNFSLACNVRKGREDVAIWYDCTIWGKRAEALAHHLTKGKTVCVTGQLVPRQYKGKDDELRTSLDIDVRELAFSGSGGGSEKPRTNPAPADTDTGIADDEIPF